MGELRDPSRPDSCYSYPGVIGNHSRSWAGKLHSMSATHLHPVVRESSNHMYMTVTMAVMGLPFIQAS